jgi:hypothetical protein
MEAELKRFLWKICRYLNYLLFFVHIILFSIVYLNLSEGAFLLQNENN